jgi:hypothetical protein
MNRIHFILLALVLTLFGGCGRDHDRRTNYDTVYLGGKRIPAPNADKRMNFDNVSYWEGDNVSGKPRIHISLSQQKAFFYKDDRLVGISSISTGREGFNSPSGNFKIVEKSKDHVSSLYGNYIDAQTGAIVMKEIDTKKDKMPKGCKYDGARMPYYMRFAGGVGMHEGFLPGYPASHGCIRMPGFMAEAFFRNVEIGTPVVVTP